MVYKQDRQFVMTDQHVSKVERWNWDSPTPLAAAVMGKHPDLKVAHPTSTIFPTIGQNFEIS
jgi:hypothetical protein